MNTEIAISKDNLKAVADILNKLLSDEYVLYTKTRNAHWNVEGINFIELHKFFQSQYEEIDEIIDNTAERIRALGHYSLGSLKDFLELTHISDENNEFNNELEAIFKIYWWMLMTSSTESSSGFLLMYNFMEIQ